MFNDSDTKTHNFSKLHNDHLTDDGESSEGLLSKRDVVAERTPQRNLAWIISTVLFALLFASSVVHQIIYRPSNSYETGFETDLGPAKEAIFLKQVRFYGGIFVNETGQFDLHLNPDTPRYSGHPTRGLDAAWDVLVGSYIALDDEEAARISRNASKENGAYYVVPTVQHSLHCVNYLRKALYFEYYPSVHEDRENIPNYWTHVDHCIETLRETIQCNMDMTPVPHIWAQHKQMYLANTELVHTCRDFDALLQWEKEREEHS
ncbi:hypothetical protein BDV26DRAFT_296218 [Aspergillus bertholletiae]|uniref:Uncharacterized protein n=1 Tax=Aspergillus bertholletiae TaxID=1226010 RepID=A0A5N7AXS1_9EURO|nr:hypothetical protein BDV26DRAFT_296218 [Aspergillus bertholletiae]